MTVMNGGEDTGAELQRMENRDLWSTISLFLFLSCLFPNPIFSDWLFIHLRYFYTLAFFHYHQSCFFVFGLNFFSRCIQARISLTQTNNARESWETRNCVPSALEIVSKLEEIFYSGCAVSSLIVRLGGTLDRLCCQCWALANQHLLLEFYHLQFHIMKG